MSGTFLASSLSQAYYSLFLLPLLVTVVRAGSVMRSPVAWVAVCLFAGQVSWTFPGYPGLTHGFGVAQFTLAWALLFVVLVTWVLRSAPSSRPAPSSLAVPATRQDPPDVRSDTVAIPVVPDERAPVAAGV
jgi:arabinofuranan 3-O-arabinosyltransferase